MDEPTSALDPISTSRIEELAMELKKDYTIVMVTHNMQQAARISDKTAFFLLGDMVEFGPTEQIFSMPQDTSHRRLHHGEVWLDAHPALTSSWSCSTEKLIEMGALCEDAISASMHSAEK